MKGRVMKRQSKIENWAIGEDHPVYIIAELSTNHNQNFDQALQLNTPLRWGYILD